MDSDLDGTAPAERELGQATDTDWPVWMAPAALLGAVVLANFGALLIDIPAIIFGVNVNSSKLPPGLEIAGTFVQDFVFVLACVLCARLGGRAVSAWQFGLRPTHWLRAAWLVAALLVGFILFSAIWDASLGVSGKEKVLEQLGTHESALLLVLSALLTTVAAPIGEEFLFRGFIFKTLTGWRGPWPAAVITGLLFGAVHLGSAPVVDLAPLAAFGFGLCLLYWRTNSLYPCIVAHSLNNSLAFGSMENWGWQIPVLMIASLTVIAALALSLRRLGVISSEPALAEHQVFGVASGG